MYDFVYHNNVIIIIMELSVLQSVLYTGLSLQSQTWPTVLSVRHHLLSHVCVMHMLPLCADWDVSC